MLRLILRLIGIRDFETCASCETLREQLTFERAEKQQLTETLLSIIKPKTYEAPPTELNPIVNTSGLFSRRRAALEARDRQEAQILKEKKFVAQPDIKEVEKLKKEVDRDVERLESELGISEGVLK